jgi:SHS2 domain-containing protein
MYELFEHTADLGLRVQANTLDELLVEAARGLLAMLVANTQDVRPVQTKNVTIDETEPAYLLFDWLSELLYAFDSDRLLLSEFSLKLHDHRLTATCRGEPMDASRHQMEHEVKAITYHALRVEQTAAGWQAEVIVDI